MAETDRRKPLVIIIPAYNEEKNISELLEQLQKPEIRKIADVVVIDDGSTDRTTETAKTKCDAVLRQSYNLGYGCALQTGYLYAVRNGYQYVIQMDADGQHDICNVQELYRVLTTPGRDGRRPDLVLGSRFLPDSAPYSVGILKKAAILFFRKLIAVTTGKKITDPTTGLQGLSRRAVQYYAGYDHFDDRYPDANMLMQMLLLGFTAEEIPAVMHERKAGKSMHAGIVRPVLYMCRMAISMMAVWVRVKILRVDAGAADVG